MTDISSEDHDLIRRYLARGLTEEEELMVETRIVGDAAFRGEVELTAALKKGLRELERQGEVARLLKSKPAWWRRPQFAVAASVAAAALALGAYLVYQERRDAVPLVAAVETLRFERMRGGGLESDVVWKRGSPPARLQMHFDVGLRPASTYVVTISPAGEGVGAARSSQVVSTSPDGVVVLAVDGALLEPGDYEIWLEPRPATELAEAVTYSLAVTRR